MNLSDAWHALKRKVAPPNAVRCEPDNFPLDPDSPLAPGHRRINEFFASLPEPRVAFRLKLAQSPAAKAILASPQPELFLCLHAILIRRAWLDRYFARRGYMDAPVCEFREILAKLASRIYQRDPCATLDEAAALISIVAEIMLETRNRNYERDIPALLDQAEALQARGLTSPALAGALSQLKAALSQEDDWEGADRRRMKQAIDRLLAAGPVTGATGRKRQAATADRSDPWAAPIADYLAGLEGPLAPAWDNLVAHARTASSSRPSGKWLKEAGRLVELAGKDTFQQKVVEWFPAVRPTERTGAFGTPGLPMLEENADLLKGLVWCCGLFEDAAVIQAVSALAQACFKKVPMFGPLSARVGNACLCTLSALPGLEPIAQLSRLRLRIKYNVALRLIDSALQEAATKMGMTTAELEEICVPTYGLDETGALREEFGEFTAEVKIIGTDSTELRWLRTDGREQKSVPAGVKETFGEDWKDLKRTIGEIEKMLPAQRDRIERLFMQEREWSYDPWLERYHRHPLMSGLSRRLIWHFRQGAHCAAGAWRDGRFVDADDQPLDWLSSNTRVRLWHPLGSEVAQVAAWRAWLERHQVTQPFKQAHREIYILTEAELRTGTYSNRFAAHILRQHQFAALAHQRGWKYTLQGAFDSHNTPSLLLPGWDLAAEFWVDSAGANGPTSEMGIYLYLSTDQVRFCDTSGAPRPLTEVPALVFSEVMRDIDLFVSVCSIGNDPAWQDRGETAAYGGYWREASFGELSVNARTRREVLDRLLPRLKIAGQCSLSERFLVVRGELRTYKIHLGSGNILMEPNDQYLCIVPDRTSRSTRQTQDVFLPFEGDHTLAVILSKAFLLAEDTKIKDETITRQIR